jgi:hypothetical protein
MAATFAGLLFGYLLAGVYIGIPQILLVLLAVSMGITVLYRCESSHLFVVEEFLESVIGSSVFLDHSPSRDFGLPLIS